MNPKSTDIFGRLDWLTKFIKRLSGRVTALEQNPGGLTAVAHDASLSGDGTVGSPLSVNFPTIPSVSTGQYDFTLSAFVNCTVDYVTIGQPNMTIINSTIFTFGAFDVIVTTPGNPWSFDIQIPNVLNPYANFSDAAGTMSYDGKSLSIECIPGTTGKFAINDYSGSCTSGRYTFTIMSKNNNFHSPNIKTNGN